jgi:hypothetical protein
MHWELVLVLVMAVPVILFPAAYVWHTNARGIYSAVRKFMAGRAARRKQTKVTAGEVEAGQERS